MIIYGICMGMKKSMFRAGQSMSHTAVSRRRKKLGHTNCHSKRHGLGIVHRRRSCFVSCQSKYYFEFLKTFGSHAMTPTGALFRSGVSLALVRNVSSNSFPSRTNSMAK